MSNGSLLTKQFDFVDKSFYIKCNHNKDVENCIVLGKRYLFEFPETNRIIIVVCSFKGVNACDMKIISSFVNEIKLHDDDDYIFKYNYTDVDKIHFTSFSYKESCVLYMLL